MARPVQAAPKIFRTPQTTDIGQVGGTGSALANNTVYQAASDGFVRAYTLSAGGDIQVLSDSANPPTTIAGGDSWQGLSGSALYIGGAPVKRGDYWKLIGGSTNIFWVPYR